MMNTKEEIFDLINQNPRFHLATIENNQPHVRGLLLFAADERGIIFHTGTFKDLHRQLQANPSVEMCFFCPKTGNQLRVSGELIQDKSPEMMDEIFHHPTRAFLRNWGDNVRDQLAVYRLPKGKACVWNMNSNFEKKNYIVF